MLDFGIGLRVSHGCVRLRNEDNETLFHKVPVGTRVEFINQPIKFAEEPNGDLISEVHQPLSRSESEFENFDTTVPSLIHTSSVTTLQVSKNSNQDILKKALDERSGSPVLRIDQSFNWASYEWNQSNSVSRLIQTLVLSQTSLRKSSFQDMWILIW